MKKIVTLILGITCMALGVLAQQPNPPHKARTHTKVIKRVGMKHKKHHGQTKHVANNTKRHMLKPVYVKGKHSYRPEDNEAKINGGHAQNMARNLNYQNTSQPLPANTGGTQK